MAPAPSTPMISLWPAPGLRLARVGVGGSYQIEHGWPPLAACGPEPQHLGRWPAVHARPTAARRTLARAARRASDGMPLLFNLATVASVLTAYPATPLLVVEGEKDVTTAGGLGLLATTNADGANKWRVEDTRKLIELGAQKIIVCPDNDGPGIEHGIRVAKMLQQAGVEVRWLELPGLGAQEDLSDWVPTQTH